MKLFGDIWFLVMLATFLRVDAQKIKSWENGPSLQASREKLDQFIVSSMTDRKKGRETLTPTKESECALPMEVLYLAPVLFKAEEEFSFKQFSGYNCRGLSMAGLKLPFVSLYNSGALDASGRFLGCNSVGYQAGGGSLEYSWPIFPLVLNESMTVKDRRGAPRTVRLAFVMTHHHAQSLYRFLTEALGKYLIAHKFLRENQKVEIVIPDSDAVQNLMVALGEDETRLRRVKQGDWLLIQRGVFAPAYTDREDKNSHRDPLCYHKLTSALLLHMFFDGNTDAEVDRIVILSRFANTKEDDCNVNTCLLNGEELVSAIETQFAEDYKVSSLDPRSGRPGELVTELGHARAVISLNGIGLGWILAMQKGNNVIDIDYMYPRNSYDELLKRQKLGVHRLIHPRGHGTPYGLVVDVERIVGLLNLLL
ncbi:hypothetical protein NDN08_002006 [Rhodosorus marinus]|uniref:Uncharacterized protein n=1 Tax=Rhodosorus marinus TaxID=101924 RepID=A0AAV8UTW9_9RHOD|nr:hypothetical protein NDN08_002006 [Rhodosorus marinus]